LKVSSFGRANRIRVTAWDVTPEKGKPSPMHQHRYDLVGVDLSDTTAKVVNPDGTSQTDSEELVKGAARAVIFELK